MKKVIGFIICLALVLLCAAAMADVKINAANFPDEGFRNHVMKYDLDGNMTLSDDELSAVTEIDCHNQEIYNLRGVEHFTNLETLLCYYCKLTELDVSKNTALVKLWCYSNKIPSLNLSKNAALEMLSCHTNKLTSLDVRHNRLLSRLVCSWNQISVLDLRGCPILNKLVQETKPEVEEVDGYYQLAYIQGELRVTVDPEVKVIVGEELTDIRGASVSAIEDQVYKGKAVEPAVRVELNGTQLVPGTDYTVAYKDNDRIGTATVTITGQGNYSGEITATFRINPKGVKLSSLKAGKKQVALKWKKGKGITGYEIQYSLKKKFPEKKTKTVTVARAKTVSKIIKKLKAGKTYYFRIRTYKKVENDVYYSAWSAVKKVKVK